tara:strand:- start:1331 stop:1909 length:579 start_codon:yes stop_codon:yes gene_type:complete
MVWVKTRDTAYNWTVGQTVPGFNNVLILNEGYAAGDTANTGGQTQYFNDTAPTSSVFTVGTAGGTNKSGDRFIAYCFAPKPGFSAQGSWVGSSSGTFNYCGFRPKLVLWKETTSSGNWQILDSERNTYNPRVDVLFPNLPNGETDSPAGSRAIDFLSNGFMTRGTDSDINTAGQTYVWMAFAESPFNFARAA